MPTPVVRESHREDFDVRLRQRSRSADDFDLSATPWHIEAERPRNAAVVFGIPVGSVVVKSKRNGVTRTYENRATPGSRHVKWVEEAIRDVDAGVFG